MKPGRAFVAGVAGGAAMTVLGVIVRVFGAPINLEMMLGTLLFSPGAVAWIVGLLVHLVVSGAIALLYGLGFERITHRASPAAGMAFSIMHTVIGGFAVMFVPLIHPLMPGPMSAPGPFMIGLGMSGVVFFIVAHLLYGAIVGALYGAVEHPREPYLRRTTTAPRATA